MNSVAFVLRADIVTADNRHLFIADEHFAMIAESEAHHCDGIEPTNFAADGLQRPPEIAGEAKGTEGIEENSDLRAAFLGVNEGVAESLAERSRRKPIDFQADRGLRVRDGGKHRRKNFAASAKPLASGSR